MAFWIPHHELSFTVSELSKYEVNTNFSLKKFDQLKKEYTEEIYENNQNMYLCLHAQMSILV